MATFIKAWLAEKGEMKLSIQVLFLICFGVVSLIPLLVGEPVLNLILVIGYMRILYLCGYEHSKALVVFLFIAGFIGMIGVLLPNLVPYEWYFTVPLFLLTAPLTVLYFICTSLMDMLKLSVNHDTLELYTVCITAVLASILYLLPYFIGKHKRKRKDEPAAQTQK